VAKVIDLKGSLLLIVLSVTAPAVIENGWAPVKPAN
jgi:hypothetical protein